MKKIYFSKVRYISMFVGFLFVFSALLTSILPNKFFLYLTIALSLSMWSIFYEFYVQLYVMGAIAKKWGIKGSFKKFEILDLIVSSKGYYTIKDMSKVLEVSPFQSYLITNMALKSHELKVLNENKSWVVRQISHHDDDGK